MSDELSDINFLFVTHWKCQTVVFQGSKDLARVWCAHLAQLFYADCRGHELHNLRKTARSPTTVAACHSHHSPSKPKAAQGEGQMGGSPKASATASGRGNQPAGGTRRSTAVAQVSVTSREMAIVGKVQSQPRFSPRRGNGSSRAQWKR